jgi:hypothetical protein
MGRHRYGGEEIVERRSALGRYPEVSQAVRGFMRSLLSKKRIAVDRAKYFFGTVVPAAAVRAGYATRSGDWYRPTERGERWTQSGLLLYTGWPETGE